MNLFLSFVGVLVVVFVQSPLTNAYAGRFRRDDEPPAPAAAKKCIKCISYEDCGTSTSNTMDCTKENMGDITFDGPEKIAWELLVAAHEDLKKTESYTHCITMQFDGNAEIRGCAPGKIGEVDTCVAIKNSAPTSNFSLCEVCDAVEVPCNNQTTLKPLGAKDAAVDISFDVTLYCWILSAVLLKLML